MRQADCSSARRTPSKAATTAAVPTITCSARHTTRGSTAALRAVPAVAPPRRPPSGSDSSTRAATERAQYAPPITRTVTDNALMLNVLAGPDTSDPTSLPADGVDYVTELNNDIKGWRIAYSPDLGYAEVDSEIASICRTAVQAFENLGAHVTEATPAWENPVDAMWNGIWVPGIGSGRPVQLGRRTRPRRRQAHRADA